jgi:hypothetical protein
MKELVSNSKKDFPYFVERNRPTYKKYKKKIRTLDDAFKQIDKAMEYANSEIKWDFTTALKEDNKKL